MRLILFDIDGTLISSGGAGVRSLNRAFQEIFGISDAFIDIPMAGKTDFQIIKEALLRHEIHSGNGIVPLVAQCYLKNLRQEIVTSPSRHIKPGVVELLERLRDREESYCTGLLTGNIHLGARIKLDAFGLNEYFSFGAFGDDNEDRDHLLPYAVRRFAALKGLSVEPEDCVVIGDTPLDVRCARSHGARCIAVATGPYTAESLARAGADAVLADLGDTDGVMTLLT